MHHEISNDSVEDCSPKLHKSLVFVLPTGYMSWLYMPIVIIRAFKRTQQQKEKLAEAITEDVCKTFNVSKEHVRIYFEDQEKSDVFIGGVSLQKRK